MTKQEVRPLWLGLSAGTAVAVLAAGLFLISSETVLRSSFSTALGHASVTGEGSGVGGSRFRFGRILAFRHAG